MGDSNAVDPSDKLSSFVLEFGSHVRDPSNARDIDVMYRGIPEEEAKRIVRERYPNDGHLPVDATPVDEFSDRVTVPVPCDSPNTRHRFLWIGETGDEPTVVVERHCDTVASILREGAGLEKALRRLEKKECVELPLEERGDGCGTSTSHPYLTGRLSLAKAARDHFGEDNTKALCKRLWWGPLLRRLTRERPDEAAVQEIRGKSGGYLASRLFVDNNKKTQGIATQYGPFLMGRMIRRVSVEDALKWLYPKK